MAFSPFFSLVGSYLSDGNGNQDVSKSGDEAYATADGVRLDGFPACPCALERRV